MNSFIVWLERKGGDNSFADLSARLGVEVRRCSPDEWDPNGAPSALLLRAKKEEVTTTLRWVRKVMPPHLPIIVLSPDDVSGLGLDPGLIVDFWREPISPEELARRINFVLALRERRGLAPLFGSSEFTHSEFLDSLIENLPNMVFVKEARSLRFVRFNRAGEDLLGYGREELIGKNDFDFFPAEQAKFFVEKDRAVLAGKSIVEIAEEVIQTKARGQRILRTKKIPVFGSTGQPTYLLGISEDITDRIRKDQEKIDLARAQAKGEEREAASRRMFILAESSMILAASFDYRKSAELFVDLLVPLFADGCRLRIKPLGKAESSWVVHRGDARWGSESRDLAGGESVFERESSRPGLRSFLAVPLRVRDQVLGCLQLATVEGGRVFTGDDFSAAEELGRRAGVAIDNAQLYETAQKAIKARDEFLSIASHELKTPMTSLKLQVQITRRMVDVLENRVPSAARLAKVLDISLVQVDRLNALVDDLLDVSRIESGKLTYEFERLELGLLVREMTDRYFEHMRSAGCQVSLNAEELVWVNGDRFRLEQVVLNLLSNAAKYGRARPVELKVWEDDGRACVAMKDSGLGIAEDMIEKIFERFERAVCSQQIGGLGLGLYICQEIVRAHGGQISVQSKLGEGSTFLVELPLWREEKITDGLFTESGERKFDSYLPSRTKPGEIRAP